MEFDELAGKRQAEPGALDLLAFRGLLELFEDRLDVFGSDSGTGIADRDFDVSVSEPRRDLNVSFRRGELDRVGNEVENDLTDAPFVGGHSNLLRFHRQPEFDSAATRPLGLHGDSAAQDFWEGDLRDLQLHPTGFDLGQVEEVVDQRKQMLACFENVFDVGQLAFVQLAEHLLVQHLGEPDDRVQRRAQLVRHVREELRLVLARRLELPVDTSELVVHPVHVASQRAKLVTVGHVELAREIAGRDLFKALLGPSNRSDQ